MTNRNAIPFDPRKPLDPSGLRLGTPAITTRGLTTADMPQIATWIEDGVAAARSGREDELARIRGEVRELAAAHPLPAA